MLLHLLKKKEKRKLLNLWMTNLPNDTERQLIRLIEPWNETMYRAAIEEGKDAWIAWMRMGISRVVRWLWTLGVDERDATRRRGSLQSACEGTRWAANSLGSVDRVSSLPDVVSRRATLRHHSRSGVLLRKLSLSCSSRSFCSKKYRTVWHQKKKKKNGRSRKIIVHNSHLVEDLCLIQTKILWW